MASKLSWLLKLFGSTPAPQAYSPPGPPVRGSRLDEARAHALAYYKRGNQLKDRGELEASLVDYDQAVALDPGCAYALCNRGVVLSRLNRLDAALDSFDRAIAVTPEDALVFFNRADVLRQLDRPEEALASYDRAIAIKPDYLESYCNRGNLLTELGRSTQALASFDRALGISTGSAEVYFGRGRLLQNLRRLDEARADFERACELNPNFAEAFCAHGGMLMELDRLEEALASLDKAIALKPAFLEAHKNRANTFLSMKRYAEAILAFEKVLACDPEFRFTHGLRHHAKMLICDWSNLDADVEQLVAGIRADAAVSPPFPLLATVDDVSLLQRAAQKWVQKECPAIHDLPAPIERVAHSKLRIGYFSGDFYDHPVGVLTAELFERHDRSRFEITAFSLGLDRPSPLRSRLEKAFDRFIDVRGKSDYDVALLARSCEIDVAVDLSGHTAASRLGILARRPAPIQVTWLGYPGTTGADYIDYLIADSTVIPPEHQRHYDERIIYLPHSYLPNDSTRVIDAAPGREQTGLPAGGFVFCCFNNSYKIVPEVLAVWARILARVDRSVLWLSQNNPVATSNLQREAGRHGIDPNRLIFAGRTPTLSQHLGRLQHADLFLDTSPYNAHTTAIDALWTGVPLLTRIGCSFAGRVAASLLRAIELPELITTSVQQYEDLAVELATDPPRLGEIRQRLARNRLTTPLFDSRSFVRDLEDAYTNIYERHRARLPPDHVALGGTRLAGGCDRPPSRNESRKGQQPQCHSQHGP